MRGYPPKRADYNDLKMVTKELFMVEATKNAMFDTDNFLVGRRQPINNTPN
jgi:hypothetical protein